MTPLATAVRLSITLARGAVVSAARSWRGDGRRRCIFLAAARSRHDHVVATRRRLALAVTSIGGWRRTSPPLAALTTAKRSDKYRRRRRHQRVKAWRRGVANGIGGMFDRGAGGRLRHGRALRATAGG